MKTSRELAHALYGCDRNTFTEEDMGLFIAEWGAGLLDEVYKRAFRLARDATPAAESWATACEQVRAELQKEMKLRVREEDQTTLGAINRAILDAAVLKAADEWERYEEDDYALYERKLENAVRAWRVGNDAR